MSQMGEKDKLLVKTPLINNIFTKSFNCFGRQRNSLQKTDSHICTGFLGLDGWMVLTIIRQYLSSLEEELYKLKMFGIFLYKMTVN